jgi:hypothetical protein
LRERINIERLDEPRTATTSNLTQRANIERDQWYPGRLTLCCYDAEGFES